MGGYYSPGKGGPCVAVGVYNTWHAGMPSNKKKVLNCLNQIDYDHYQDDLKIFEEMHQHDADIERQRKELERKRQIKLESEYPKVLQGIQDENAKSVQKQLDEVRQLSKKDETLMKAAQLFTQIKELLYPKDRGTLAEKLTNKLIKHSYPDIVKGKIRETIATLEIAQKVANNASNEKISLKSGISKYKKWQKTWESMKKNAFPAIYEDLRNKRLQTVKVKMRQVNLPSIGGVPWTPQGHACTQAPEYLALNEALANKRHEYGETYKNTEANAKKMMNTREPQSAINTLTDFLNSWEHHPYAKSQLEKMLSQAKVLLKYAENAEMLGDKYSKKADYASALREYQRSLSTRNNATVERKLDDILEKISSAKKILAETRKEWISGHLDKAIHTVQTAKGFDSSNKEIVKTFKAMKGQKKMMDDALKKADQSIEQKKFDQAKSALEKAKLISQKYPPYIEMLQKLREAEGIAEEKPAQPERGSNTGSTTVIHPNPGTLQTNSKGYWQLVEEKGSIGRECTPKEIYNNYYRDTVSGFGSQIKITKMVRKKNQVYCEVEGVWQRASEKLYPGSTIELPVTINRLVDTGKYHCKMTLDFDMHDMECGSTGGGGKIGSVTLDRKSPSSIHKAITWKVKEPFRKKAGEKLTIRACYNAQATICGNNRGMKYYYEWMPGGSATDTSIVTNGNDTDPEGIDGIVDLDKTNVESKAIPNSENNSKVGIAGKWKTSDSNMILFRNGQKFNGTYDLDGGKIFGELKGSILEGKWSEKNSDRRCKTSIQWKISLGQIQIQFSK